MKKEETDQQKNEEPTDSTTENTAPEEIQEENTVLNPLIPITGLSIIFCLARFIGKRSGTDAAEIRKK